METKLPSGTMWASIGTLVMAIAVFQLANGFLGSLVSLRVEAVGFDEGIVGVVLAGYFIGYTVGALRAASMIRRVGHIRAFAAFAGGAAACVVVMPLLVDPWIWTLVRMIIGFCCAGLFIAVESWLNAKAEPSNRGRVFAIYMVAFYAAMATGQLLLGEVDLASVGAFNLITCLFAIALVMIALTRAGAPRQKETPRLPYGQLSRAAPVAVAGVAVFGMVSGIFYTLAPVWAQANGYTPAEIGQFMFAAILGGLCFQPLIGRLSDAFDRRYVVAGLALGLAVALTAVNLLETQGWPWFVADFCFGGFLFTLYPVCVAHAVDRMDPNLMVEIGGRLILISGVASSLGPIIGNQAVVAFGVEGFVYVIAALSALLTTMIVIRGIRVPAAIRHKQRYSILSDQVPIPADDRGPHDPTA
ncbi:MAG: MFS transporter [Pseudomonadota bacterium]